MPKFKIKKVTVRTKGRTPVRIVSIPASAEGKVIGQEGEKIEVRVNRDNLQDEKIAFLLEQNKELDRRLTKIERAWYRRLWKYMNKERKAPWQK